MLAARPVVVTNVADTTTLIEDNRTGFIAAGATVDALDEAVSRAWTKRKDWPIIGHRASERITQMYTTDGVENLTEYIMQFASKN
jgi:glycosyltransferase involved in cell wall biosynthesis